MELLEKHFETAFSAPDGIQKLRKLILTLAMQGKLVPQDPHDQPASELLKEIAAEWKRLARDGKIREQKALPEIGQEDVPYGLPVGWVWERLGRISNYIQRGIGPAYSEVQRIPVISQKCIQWSGFNQSVVRFADPSTLSKYQEERFIRIDDLLWNSTGTGTIGRICIYKDELSAFDVVVADSHVTVVRLFGLCNDFVLKFLMSPIVQNHIEENASGTTNQIELNTAMVFNQVVPIPPLSEQHRIVAKIDDLMARCDELERLRIESERKRLEVHTAAIGALLAAQDKDDFGNVWQFISRHFGDLYTAKKNVADLRKAILQLAVMGKLVPQNPQDQPASELLHEIAAEKRKLVKEGKIKVRKAWLEITEEETPYELPIGWEWVRLASIGEINPRNVCDGAIDAGFVPMSLVSSKFGVPHKFEVRKWLEISKGFTHFANSDVGMAKITPCFENTKSCIFEALPNGIGAGTTELHVFRNTFGVVQPKFLLAYLKNPRFIESVVSRMTGTAGQKRVPTDIFAEHPFPLPPLAEQHRIVQKIDQLMALCDELETQITAATGKQTALLNAVMAQV